LEGMEAALGAVSVVVDSEATVEAVWAEATVVVVVVVCKGAGSSRR
jgi:hypothetical protein